MTTPDDQAVYLKAATDLARMTPPDLSDFAPSQVEIAMLKAFESHGPREDWLDEFRGRIKQASENTVSLDSADPADFPHPRDKSRAASYQQLIDASTGTVQLLVMGPFNPPFRFVAASRGEDEGEDP
ncbi:hypothetical protein [Streptomyces sp. NPDC054952]